jgi:2-polyprenyl-6-methoxyphenol hydroxylase-like FAD-dependent oxidoreductase
MAEGASMALEDALVLAEMLAVHGSPDEALSAFSERRRTRVRWVQHRTHRRDRIRALPVPLRDLALRWDSPLSARLSNVVRETIASENRWMTAWLERAADIQAF